MQRYAITYNSEGDAHLYPTNTGEYVLYADAMERERVLREALEAMTDFLRHAEWDSHSTEVHVGNLVEQARAALAQ